MFEKYVSLLKENAVKITFQRLEILRYLDTHNTHPTVDQIYLDLKEHIPSLSKTTVYHSLEIFKTHGMIQTLTISDSELRYDCNCAMHRHFLCKCCGRIIDIDSPCPYLEKIRKEGYQVEEAQGYFKGICKDCLQKENNGS